MGLFKKNNILDIKTKSNILSDVKIYSRPVILWPFFKNKYIIKDKYDKLNNRKYPKIYAVSLVNRISSSKNDIYTEEMLLSINDESAVRYKLYQLTYNNEKDSNRIGYRISANNSIREMIDKLYPLDDFNNHIEFSNVIGPQMKLFGVMDISNIYTRLEIELVYYSKHDGQSNSSNKLIDVADRLFIIFPTIKAELGKIELDSISILPNTPGCKENEILLRFELKETDYSVYTSYNFDLPIYLPIYSIDTKEDFNSLICRDQLNHFKSSVNLTINTLCGY